MLIESLFSEIQTISEHNNFEISNEKNFSICKFLIQLNNWNKVHNLTGHNDNKNFIEKHVLDAWSAIGPLKKKSTRRSLKPIH